MDVNGNKFIETMLSGFYTHLDRSDEIDYEHCLTKSE